MDLGLGQTLSAQQRQQQSLSVQQQQSLKILQETNKELRERIENALDTNPALERLENDAELVRESEPSSAMHDMPKNSDGGDTFGDGLGDYGGGLDDGCDFGDGAFDGGDDMSPNPNDSDAEKLRKFRMDSIEANRSLDDELREQVLFACGKDTVLRNAVDVVLASLDEHGYLRESDDSLAELAGVPVEVAHRAVECVQSFDPAGIGAHSLQECLLLQLEREGEAGTLAWSVVNECMDLLGKKDYSQVAEVLGATVDEVMDALDRIRKLEPYPASDLGMSRDQENIILSVVATIRQEPRTGVWLVDMENDNLPRLGINQHYLNKVKSKAYSKQDAAYINAKISEGRDLINGIAFRESTIERVTEAIVERQKEYLEEGEEKLRPMKLADLAEELNVSESTISRAISNKAVRTPWGVVPYKRLFATGLATSDGEAVATTAIQKRIVEILENCQGGKKLSDQKICDMLAAEGVKVARRTVNKYRKQAGY